MARSRVATSTTPPPAPPAPPLSLDCCASNAAVSAWKSISSSSYTLHTHCSHLGELWQQSSGPGDGGRLASSASRLVGACSR
jgi:hypothetical protein